MPTEFRSQWLKERKPEGSNSFWRPSLAGGYLGGGCYGGMWVQGTPATRLEPQGMRVAKWRLLGQKQGRLLLDTLFLSLSHQ